MHALPFVTDKFNKSNIFRNEPNAQRFLVWNMICRDHVFNYGPRLVTRVTKFREKKTGEALAETVFSQNFVTLGANFEGHNWKHDLARLCFMLYTPSYGNSQLKMEILEFTSKEAAAPLMSLAAPLWYWKFWKKILDLGNFFRNFENHENFENFDLKFPK